MEYKYQSLNQSTKTAPTRASGWTENHMAGETEREWIPTWILCAAIAMWCSHRAATGSVHTSLSPSLCGDIYTVCCSLWSVSFSICYSGEFWHEPSGRLYKGRFREGRFHGQGELLWFADSESRKKYIGEFRNGEMNGQGEMKWVDTNFVSAHI